MYIEYRAGATRGRALTAGSPTLYQLNCGTGLFRPYDGMATQLHIVCHIEMSMCRSLLAANHKNGFTTQPWSACRWSERALKLNGVHRFGS